MKKIIRYLGIAVVILLAASEVYAFEIETTSNIVRVIVYPDSALITRQATIQLEPGSHKIIFANIIPDIKEDSLQMSGRGTAEVKLFGAQVKKEFLTEVPSEGIKRLKEEIQKLEDVLRQINDSKSLLLEKKEFLDSLRLYSANQIPKDLTTRLVKVEELEGLLKFLDEKLKENYSQVFDCDSKKRDLENKIMVLKSELQSIFGPAQKLKRSIIVELEVFKAGSLDLSVSYLVRGASWRPLYDVRGNLEKEQIELVYYGMVRQTTGEHWQDTEVLLATAKPSLGGRMPETCSLFLQPFQPRGRWNDRVVFEGGSRNGLMTYGATYDLGLKTEFKNCMQAESNTIQEAKIDYALAEQKGIAVVYRVPHQATIKSDGTEYKLPITSSELKAGFEYFSYPRTSPLAYLGTKVTNAKDTQLLSGPMNVFLEGDLVGSSSIDNISPNEEFELYLGADENVKIKREEIQKKIDDILIGSIPSSTKRTRFTYKITVENYKPKKIKVNLFEAMPVSGNEQIKVKIEEVSLEPKTKEYKDKKGIWHWQLELGPKAKQEIFYTYTIEHPRGMQIEEFIK